MTISAKSKIYRENYRKQNLQMWRDSAKKWRTANPDKVRKYRKMDYRDNGEKMRAYHRAHMMKWLAIPANRVKQLVCGALKRAKEKGFAYDDDLLSSVMSKPITHCECCGIEFDFTTGKRKVMPRSPSVDRRDNSKGYIIANVALICWRCNNSKSDLTVADLRIFLRYMTGKPRAVHG